VIFAFLTAILWAFAGFGSSRIARHFGSAQANALRLVLASLLLTLIGAGLGTLRIPPGAAMFALSGFLHLALGDIALFAVYRRLGPRIGVLAVSSLAPPTAMAVEWLLLGTAITFKELALAAGVLVCVILAVAPKERKHLTPAELRTGILAALLATLGQGCSAAVSRLGFAQAADAGIRLGPWMPTLLRCATGAICVLLWLAARQILGHKIHQRPADLIPHRRIEGHPLGWLALSTLLGPVIGVLTLMTALESHPAALVQAVLATLPVMMLPVAWFFDGNAPSRRSLLFGILAVALAVWIVMM
jgi:drug/metabolite transporter (DMT)-like permease